MQIHLSDISSMDGKCIRVSADLSYDAIEIHYGSRQTDHFPILRKQPAKLVITNTGNKVLELSGTGEITVGIPCDRCLKEVEVTLPLSFQRKMDMKLTDEERADDLDESSYLTGMDLDVDRLVYLEILMCWPLKVLCREDCKGICSRCGKDLNEGPCDCAEEPKDPRMAAISDIFRKFKEV